MGYPAYQKILELYTPSAIFAQEKKASLPQSSISSQQNISSSSTADFHPQEIGLKVHGYRML